MNPFVLGAAQDGPAPGAVHLPALSREGVHVYNQGQTLWLQLSDAVLQKKAAVLPRLCAPIRSVKWQGHPEAALDLSPEPSQWVISWKAAPAGATLIQLELEGPPFLPAELPAVMPAADGSILLHAHQAVTVGEKLRFEPQPHKNTVGYWTNPNDYALWKLNVDQPGTFSVAVLQGCGAGQGGSDAVLSLRQDASLSAELTFQTVTTGHFQNFRWLTLGKVRLEKPGPYELRITPKQIAHAALCDIRMVHLVRQASESD